MHAPDPKIGATGRNRPCIWLFAVIAIVVSAVVLPAISADPAHAALQRLNTHNFGPNGNSGEFFPQETSAVAYDQTNDRLYAHLVLTGLLGWSVTAPGTYTPLPPPWPMGPAPGGAANSRGIAVDNRPGPTDGDFFRSETTGIAGFAPDGTALGSPFPIEVPAPRALCGLVQDSEGNFFVSNVNVNAVAENRTLLRYTSSGTELPPIDTSAHPGRPCRLALDADDNLYVATLGPVAEEKVWKYTAASNYTVSTLFDPAPAFAVAVNKTTGSVFVAHPERITEYDSSGEIVREFGNEIGAPTNDRFMGVAIDEATDEVYVSNGSLTAGANRRIRVFGPPVVGKPEAVTLPAAPVTRTEATLNGEVDPGGGTDITKCEFQWGATTTYGNTAPCAPEASPGTPITGPTDVSTSLPGLTPGTLYHYRVVATSSEGSTVGADRTLTTVPAVREVETGAATEITQNEATLNGSFNADGFATTFYFQYGTTTSYGLFVPVPPPGEDGGSAGSATPVSRPISGLVPGTSPNGTLYHYRLVAVNSFGTTFGEDRTFNTLPAVKALETLPATEIKAKSVTLNGTFDPNGIATDYYFEYGPTIAYGSYAPVAPPGVDGGETIGPKAVSTVLNGLEAGVTYHYRLVATNSFGTTLGGDVSVIPSEEPTITDDVATDINTDGAVLRATINPNALATSYYFEYGTEDCSLGSCQQSPPVEIGNGNADVEVSLAIAELDPNSTYHFRVIATNSLGTTTGDDQVFKTFALDLGVDSCPNVLERKQTGAGRTPACRAYELVSARDSGGYDIVSNLIPGLEPLPGHPLADDRVLYTVRYGAIPGSGNPTNHLGDPYVAERGLDGWETRYVGLQADGSPSLLPFASTLLGTDSGLEVFAFGGPDLCSPCFEDGSTNIPLRLPDGRLVKGMVGSEGPVPADPSGTVAKPLSGDGGHLIFGSNTRLEPEGNQGSLSIYDRNLETGTTQVVSTLPDGSTMPGTGLAQLAVSEDGNRILIGRLVGTDGAGNERYDLFMHIGSDAESIAVADTLSGVLYAGMSGDGSRVFFATQDPLSGDSDTSSDLYRAEVTPGGATVTRVSTGTEATGNGDACDPVENSVGSHWNAVGMSSPASCGVVAIAGGGGVSHGDGTAYFLSPEKLAGPADGVFDEPNLYVVEPGSSPDYVTTLDADSPMIRHAVNDAGTRDTADFQVTPDGAYAVFSTNLALTGATNAGHVEVFRAATGGEIVCASCAPTNGAPSSDTTLTSGGLNLIQNGRVVFTSSEQLVLQDTNRLRDVYEWADGEIGLVSTGLDTNDSGLLTASADGLDIFFFTRQSLAPQDENGGTMKIYDAREGGGFLFNPAPRDCVASDECHGPGSVAPLPPPINTYEGTEEAQPVIAAQGKRRSRCRRGGARKRGRNRNAKKSARCFGRQKKRSNHRTRGASR